ncbi:MAG: hypothetical protein KBS91_02580 [Firmicutes bacterium]|nr:hypothetical protein [Candidatus Caballimonas caccae]
MEYLQYSETTNRFILTEKYVTEVLGIDIASKLSQNDVLNTQGALMLLLDKVSTQVYNYIHKFNANNNMQDCIIKNTKGGQNILLRAMSSQLIHILTVGDLRLSTDEKQRALYFSEDAKDILNETIPELGTSLLYCGRW